MFGYIVGMFGYIVGMFGYIVEMFGYIVGIFGYIVGMFGYVWEMFGYIVGMTRLEDKKSCCQETQSSSFYHLSFTSNCYIYTSCKKLKRILK